MSHPLRIAQVAPLYESVPPTLYGGTERVVSYLTEQLVGMGHEVTLFASADSETSARLVPGCDRALRLDPECRDRLAHHVLMLEEVARRAGEFDLVHSHVDYLAFPTLRRIPTASVSTLHGRLDVPELRQVFAEFADANVVSISTAQRAPLPAARWIGRVPHGLPAELYRGSEEAGAYLAFVGRFSPEKKVEDAIAIACRTGLHLRIAAKLEEPDRRYFDAVVRPLLGDSRIEVVGEVGDEAKQELLGGALALLLPVDWPEPFGLAAIEALACGTPVIARRRGALPEIIEHGRTGFLVETVEEAVQAVERLGTISCLECRRAFEERFTAHRMAADYVSVYREHLPTRHLERAAVGGSA